jgi:hypothetical protein
MLKFFRTAGLILLSATLLLSGCSPTVQSTPTVEPQVAYTQAAQTAQAILTNAALLTPSATITPTPTKTSTPEPPTATFTVTLATPLASPTMTPQSSVDSAIYVDQSPSDGTIVTPGSEFNVTWRIKNTGVSTWTTKYRLRYYAGTIMSPVTAVNLPNTVRPQEEVTVTLPIRAPSAAGEYTTIWVLSNEQDANFFNVFVRIVVSGATMTPTIAVTATTEATATLAVTP